MSSPEKDFPASETPFAMDLEPTVMPGFTAPATDPWPPLSREQVVELHEALRDFTTDMTSARAPMSDEDQANTIWSAAVELHGTLERLGVGTPPTTRRWTEGQLQQAVEEVQSSQDAQSAADGLLARVGLPRHVLSPRPSSATEIAITSAMEAPLATPEARRQEGDWEPPPVRKNCWTCDLYSLHGGCTSLMPEAVSWMLAQKSMVNGISRDADGCPVWEQQ